MWERACPRKRYASHRTCWLIHRFREQARPHIFDRCEASRLAARLELPGCTARADDGSPNVGAGLPAKAVCQSPNMLADPPLSRASPLPHGNCVGRGFRLGRFHAGAFSGAGRIGQ
ncbi:hypothetical protein DXV65_01325 [Pseudomonas fluorescens]|nr:hypothetical protein DXV65_01325 [Pseudomonas fluorescens]